MKGIKTLSLFTGAGGLDVGFHQAGFNIIACVEIEEKYCRSLLKNREKGSYISRKADIYNIDIRDFDPRKYKDVGIECIIGGPPCQTFSAAGRRSGGVIGLHDLRGQLYEEYCSILDIIKPKVFVFENVYGLPGANGGSAWKAIVKAFSEHGYSLFAEVLDAADYGVPQHRERLVMVGVRTGEFRYPLPTHGPDSEGGTPLVSVESAIADLQDSLEKPTKGLGGLYGHLLPDVPEGLNYAYFTAEMGHPEPVFAWRSKFHDLLYKVDRKEPCRTIKANPGKFTGPFHWNNRHFTVEELKRLQSFPDDYAIVGSYGQCLEQIGNSVPPRLAYCIARSVKEQLFDKVLRSDSLSLRPPLFKSTFRTRQRERSKKFKEVAARAILEKYGTLALYDDPAHIELKRESYWVSYVDRYSRQVWDKKPKAAGVMAKLLVTEAGGHIRLDLDEMASKDAGRISVEIKISGLKKYLPRFDSLTLSASACGPEALFYCWKEVEAALVARSKFFTLIDIYGHYANRGDVVDVTTSICSARRTKLVRLIEYFSQTANCGAFVPEDSLAQSLKVCRTELDDLISSMRKLRFDIRTARSHPIIGKGRVICTYPFPLLSAKALVESRAVFLQEEIVDVK